MMENDDFKTVFTDMSQLCGTHSCSNCPFYHGICYYNFKMPNKTLALRMLDNPILEPYLYKPYLDVCLHFALLKQGMLTDGACPYSTKCTECALYDFCGCIATPDNIANARAHIVNTMKNYDKYKSSQTTITLEDCSGYVIKTVPST